MKKFSLLILALLISALALFSCKSISDNEKESMPDTTDEITSTAIAETEEIKNPLDTPSYFVGEWTAYIDFTETLNEGLKSDAEMAKYLYYENFGYTLSYTFTEDGKYSVTADINAFEASFNAALQATVDAYRKYIENTLGITGSDMTVDEFSKEYFKMTLAELAAEIFSRDTYFAILKGLESNGSYFTADGKLYSAAEGAEINGNIYEEYEIISETEFRTISSNDSSVSGFDVYPVVFTKK